MTKKDYVRAAQLITKESRQVVREALADTFNWFFRDDNPRYDHTKFYEACGVEPKESRRSVTQSK